MVEDYSKSIGFQELTKHLNLDDSEIEVLSIIHSLNKEKKSSDQAHIKRHLNRLFGEEKEVDLNQILSKLTYERLCSKDEKGNYILNLEHIQKKLFDREQHYLQNIEGVRSLQKNLEETLSEPKNLIKKPAIRYLHLDELAVVITEALRDSEKTYLVANFPDIFRPKLITERMAPERRKYVNTLKGKLEDDEFKLIVITRLGVDQPFKELLDVLGDLKKARDALFEMIDNLSKTVKKRPNLHMYSLTNPFGLDGKLLLRDEAEEFFLVIRNPSRDPVGGIHIKSTKIASEVKSIYDEILTQANPINSDNVDELAVKLKKKVDDLYNRLK